MQDGTTAADAPDPETEAAMTRAVVPEALAWSVDDGGDDETLPVYDGDDDSDAPTDLWSDQDDSRYSWHTVGIFAGLVGIAVLAASWSVGMYLTHHDKAPTPAAQLPAASPPDVIVPSTPAAPTGPNLTGAYQLVYRIGDATYRGHAGPPKRSGVATVWWAFKSSCTPVGCTASGIKLDNTDHTIASAKTITDTFTFVSGQWEDAPMSGPDTSAPRLHQ